jgi:hypothetical protein
MPRQTSEFRVVVASPLDISEERKAVFDSLTELNRTLDIQGTSLKVIGWEDYSSPGVGPDAQQVVNRQILDEYDILIGLFGTRLGTPTSQARSGTVEEIEKALSRQNAAMGEFHVQVYFGDRIEQVSQINVSDLVEVIDYQKSLHARGVFYKTFRSKEDLAREVRVNVQRAINYYLKSGPAPDDRPPAGPTATPAQADFTPEPEAFELGLLDLQEIAESAIDAANAAVNQIAELLAEITAETTQRTKEVESVSAPSIPAAEKKRVINKFAAFLKSKSTQLAAESAVAKNNFRAYFEANTSLFNLGKTDIDRDLFQKARSQSLNSAGIILSNVQEARLAITSYRETIASMPRMTIQLNQARRQFLDALDENLAFVNETEAAIVRFVTDLKSYED